MGRPKGYQNQKARTSNAMASENKEQGDEPQLSISSSQSVEGIASIRLPSREYNGEWRPYISMDTAVSKRNNINSPGNQFIQASSASVSGHNPTSGESAASNFVMPGTASLSVEGLASFHLPTREYNGGIPLSVQNPTSGEWHSYIPMDTAVRGSNNNNAPGNQFIQASSALVSAHNLTIGELAASNFVMPAGGPNAGWLRATRMPLPSSVVGFAQPAYDRPQNPPITGVPVRNFSLGTVLAPRVFGVAGRTVRHNQSGPVMVPPCSRVTRRMLSNGQLGSVVVPSLRPLRSMPLLGQPGQPVPANAVSAVKVSQGSPFPKNVRVQPARKGIPHQSQGSVSVNPSKIMGQIIVPQPSTTPSGPSHKRGSSKILPTAPAQRRKTISTIPPSPSMQTWRPVAPHVSPSSVKSLKPQIPPQLLQNTAIQSLLATQPTDYIKWDGEEKTSESGYQCPICREDLSYAAEGPMYQPDNVKSTSVLPCGHYFHSSCLLKITPDDQAENPPCIPCALDG